MDVLRAFKLTSMKLKVLAPSLQSPIWWEGAQKPGVIE